MRKYNAKKLPANNSIQILMLNNKVICGSKINIYDRVIPLHRLQFNYPFSEQINDVLK